MYPGLSSVEHDDAMNQSTMSAAGYDWKRAYGGAGDAPSVSTAGGNKSTYDPYSSQSITDASRERTTSESSSQVKSVSGNISMFSNDHSFEAMYGEEEMVTVLAPAGKLGVVIDRPNSGVPVVHAIKENSVLANQVRIGDKLLSVDGQDTRDMSAIRVSKLISSKSENPQRAMIFMRSPTDP